MRTIKNLTIIFIAILITTACSTFKQEKPIFQKRIDSLLVSDFFKKANISISAVDLANDSTFYSFNEKKLMRPASNEKVLTTSTALYFLGKDYKFSTSAFYNGEIKDSVCNGDVFIKGGFDPDFSYSDLKILANEIKNFGIKEIRGNLYADVSSMDSLRFGEGWMWDDELYTYMPSLSQLNINKNSIQIYFEPDSIDLPAKVSIFPPNNFLEIKNKSITTPTGKSTFDAVRDWQHFSNKITAFGYLPSSSKKDSLEITVAEPHLFFINLLKECLTNIGCEVNGTTDTLTTPNNAVKIYSYERSIAPVIKVTNKISDNLNAEMLLRSVAGKAPGIKQTAFYGIKFVDSLIALSGANAKDYKIVDGSGLSFYNLVSAELMTKVLTFMNKQDNSIKKIFFDSLPIGGVDGTLSNRFKNSSAKKHVFAKTGTISGVSSLSGYVETANKKLIAFSILVQNFTGSSSAARNIQDKICEIFYEEL